MKFSNIVIVPHEEDLDSEDSIECYAFHLVPKEASYDDQVHLPEIIPTTINIFEEDKDLLSYGEFTLQI
jgi:hypothetical protein